MRVLIAIVALLSICASPAVKAEDGHPHIGDDVNKLPLFDAHIHYKEPAWKPYPPEAILKLMDETGVAMGLVSSTPDEGTIMLWKHAPNRIVPELRPYHGSAGSSNWTGSPGMFEYLTKRLDTYPHEGIGEFHLHDVDSKDEALLRKIAATAMRRNLYIHVHSGKEPVDYLYSLEPGLKIIWAHAGMTEPAATVEAMMETYGSLYADTSFRESDILNAEGTINDDWRRVLERFSDRFMVGTDTWVNDQWDSYTQLIEINRKWLSLFSRPVAERIAFKNAERLFGRKVTIRQLGTR
ncbi:MAG: amidohydrolase family protein [Rhodospirillaceae bacterium]|nr:amidohydrolase family protein [Rhodospirillaceae bacterium]